MPLWQRILVVMDTLSFYAQKLVWPGGLIVDYARTPEYALTLPSIRYVWIVPLVVAAGLWLVRKRLPGVVAGVLIFVAGIFPVLGLIPFGYQSQSTVSDHYLYLSMFGIGLGFAELLGFLVFSAASLAEAARAVARIALAVCRCRYPDRVRVSQLSSIVAVVRYSPASSATPSR